MTGIEQVIMAAEQALQWWEIAAPVVGTGMKVLGGARWLRRKIFPAQNPPDTATRAPRPDGHPERE